MMNGLSMTFRTGLALALSLAFLGCKQGEKPASTPAAESSAPSHEKPVPGDWLIDHLLSDPENLNPITSNDAGASSVLGYIFEGLMMRDPRSLELKPLIADSPPDISEDKLQYTFRLRKDVHFQDGKPVTAHDVLFTVKVIKNPLVNAPYIRVYYNSIINAEALDDYTIRFKAREPYFLNESVLGGIDALPRHYYDPDGLLANVTVQQLDGDWSAHKEKVELFAESFNKNFNRNPMGSGPYRFGSWRTGEEVILTRNASYWGSGKPEIDQVHLDQIHFRVINNMDAALVALKSENLDLLGLQPLQYTRQTDTEKFRAKYEKVTYYSPSYTYVGWNNDHSIFGDRHVRTAMTHLINRKQIIETILVGLGQVVDSPIYRFRPEYDETLYSHEFSPEKARAILAEAGWRDTNGDGILDKMIDGKRVEFRFEIKFNSGNDMRKAVALTIQDELKKHGIDCSVRELDWTIYLEDVRNHRFDAIILGWLMSVNPPDSFQIWHSTQADNRGSNAISYKNPEVDKILEVYRKEFDQEKRIELYRSFQKILNEDQPYTFLYMPKSAVAYHKRFQNVEILPIGGLRPREWWVPAPQQRYQS
jgi:peptide/nickel transport system substrate-binding protein